MPNEVYEMTHRALSALVSHRAATRVLDDALLATGSDPDSVTVRAMRRLLAGRVRRELSATLPSPGLTRSLKQIADDLYRLQPSHTTLVDLPPPGPGDAQPAPATAEEAAVTPTVVKGPPLTRTTNVTAGSNPTLRAPAPPAELPRELELTEALMTSALRLFGELEPVEQVVIVRDGAVVLERGAGVAAERLPNLVRSTRHLLGRAGRLELFALERAEGMLFVFPVGEGAIVVVTRPNVNIGAVLAARAALEEAA